MKADEREIRRKRRVLEHADDAFIFAVFVDGQLMIAAQAVK